MATTISISGLVKQFGPTRVRFQVDSARLDEAVATDGQPTPEGGRR
jgi:hypothetical protein